MALLNKIVIVLVGITNLFSFNYIEEKNESFEIIDYETEYVYSEKYTKGEELIITEGKKGYIHEINGEQINKQEAVTEVIRLGTNEKADYEGMLTGYGPDCIGCSKEGYVACYTEDKKKWSLIHDGIVYNDSDYGKVNIVAADHTLFPCGTIIEINNNNYNKLITVVLDTGGTMRSKWRNNREIHLDLAFKEEALASEATSKTTQYHVKRWGW